MSKRNTLVGNKIIIIDTISKVKHSIICMYNYNQSVNGPFNFM